jgi:hypothetical protein
MKLVMYLSKDKIFNQFPCLYEQESLHSLLNTGEFKEWIPECGYKIEKNRIPKERPK